MLFHLGALWRLNELGYLPELKQISSVSGGSIVAAVLASRWNEHKRLGPGLKFNAKGVAGNFEAEVVEPVRSLAGRTLDWKSIGAGLVLPGGINRYLSLAYRRHLFTPKWSLRHAATLKEMPASPFFVINATNLQSGVLWRFTRPYMRDYRVGAIRDKVMPLSRAVAASSAFPPFMAPARFRFSQSDYAPPSKGEDLRRPPFTTRPVLADGGVYDNLGLETAWKRYQTILVSDGGGALSAAGGLKWRWRDWGTQGYRVARVVDNQVRDLRKRQIVAAFKAPAGDRAHRNGAYWGIRSWISSYYLDSSLDCPPETTARLADISTRLKKLDSVVQEQLINWGYAICDTAIRRWVDRSRDAPDGFPYPDVGVG
jgi:NTE family protein